jgi:UDP-2-acetamido-3-amino-2,3-dideoxy-glucuronate N-acetyltransferase
MTVTAAPAAALLDLPTFRDERGSLSVGDVSLGLPFAARRFFVVSGVPSGEVRARHANRTCHEVLVATSGGCTVDVDNGTFVTSFRLEGPGRALDVPAGLWITCRDFTSDAALLVLASADYDSADQVTDHATFVAMAAEAR